MKSAIKSPATAALATLALALLPGSLPAAQIPVSPGRRPAAQITVSPGGLIQDGVNAAGPGDTVLVLPGTYPIPYAADSPWPPGVYISTPGLKLRAAGPPGSVKIVGEGTIDLSSYPILSGILIGADNVAVEGFDISGFPTGIEIGGPTTADEVDHNTISGCVFGIFLNGSSTAGPNWWAHIHDNQVNNQVSDPPWAYAGPGSGIFVWQAPGCQLDNNKCDNNGNCGIELVNSPGCTLDSNTADGNGSSGIYLGSSGSPGCAVTNNEANDNGACGIEAWSCSGSWFMNNVTESNGQYDFAVKGSNVQSWLK